ncbi:hypothetical protein DFP72DRAFT_1168780 [Ephemerocybe angulata]|uniref:Uncharacterized protein n=1 Tax=Ephemerocybe angulata TaxID=980116 RepID=A0A8H6M5M3_9AGAR|nr:hypothetical protein DFP72DRAFT_1168780 [Tulosesus angulatus]
MSNLVEEEVHRTATYSLFYHHPPQLPHTLPENKEEFFVPGVHVPTYGLGWMIKVPGIAVWGKDYEGYREEFILPRWKEAGFPDWYTPGGTHGLMIPNLYQFGPHHIFIQIAESTRNAIEFVKTEAGTKQIVEQALKVLLLDDAEIDFGPYRNLIWLLLPWSLHKKNKKVDYPCIGDSPTPWNMPAKMRDIVEYAQWSRYL